MSIDASEYKSTKARGVKIHKANNRKYLFDFRIDGKRYRKFFDIKATNHSEKENLEEAERKLSDMKKDIRDGEYISGETKLDILFKEYINLQQDTPWTKKLKGIYNLYVKASLGNKNIEDIKPMQIQKIVSDMEKKQGLSPRTRKGVLEVLKPLFQFAIENKLIKDSPAKHINIKIPDQKRVVVNATELFKKIFIGINSYYHDNPYYKALFLFGFTGRRKGEILSLKWQNIDFNNNYYWIEKTKSGDTQKYQLPLYLIQPLSEIPDDRTGLVFKSLATGEKIVNIDRQMRQLKAYIGIENLSLHYMRNVLVSMLAEQQIEAITLSGILGHTNANTITKYLSINHHKSSQIGLDKIDTVLDTKEG